MSVSSCTVVCECGPGAGARVRLGVGRHVVGRAPSAAVSIADPTMELHHALLHITGTGPVCFVQLSGRVPAAVDGVLVSSPGGVPLRPGGVVQLGASRLRIEAVAPAGRRPPAPADELPPTPADELPPTPADELPPTPADDVPPVSAERMPSPVGAVVAGVARRRIGVLALAMCGAGVLALTRPAGVVGVVGGAVLVAVLGTAVRAWRARRRRREAEAASHRAELQLLGEQLVARRDRWRAEVVAGAPSLHEALATIVRGSPRWVDGGGGGPDAPGFRASVGTGAVRWPESESRRAERADVWALVARIELVDDVPAVADLGPGSVLTLAGTDAPGVARALLVQLAVAAGPRRWALSLAGVSLDAWAWTRSLPHARAGPGGPHVVGLVDRSDLVGRPPAHVRRALRLPARSALVVVDVEGRTELAPATSRLELRSRGTGTWWAPGEASRVIRPAGVGEKAAAQAAERLAEWAAGAAVADARSTRTAPCTRAGPRRL